MNRAPFYFCRTAGQVLGKYARRAALTLFSAVFPFTAMANVVDDLQLGIEELEFSDEMIRMIGALVVLLAIALLVVRIGRRFGADAGPPVRVLAGSNIAPGVAVRVVQVGERYWLLGVSKENVSSIAELSASDVLHPRRKERARKAGTLAPRTQAKTEPVVAHAALSDVGPAFDSEDSDLHLPVQKKRTSEPNV